MRIVPFKPPKAPLASALKQPLKQSMKTRIVGGGGGFRVPGRKAA